MERRNFSLLIDTLWVILQEIIWSGVTIWSVLVVPNLEQLLLYLFSKAAQLCMSFIMMHVNLSDMLLITLNSLMQLSESAVDLVDICDEIDTGQALILNWPHQLLLIFNGFLRYLVKIESNFLQIKLDLVVSLLNLEDGLFEIWQRVPLLNFKFTK